MSYYDHEICTKIAKESNLDENYVSNLVEKGISNTMPLTFSNSISLIPAFVETAPLLLAKQHKLIKELAGKSDCLFVGRGADAVLADLRRPIDEKMELIEKIAMPQRLKVWKELGIMPGGAKDEVFNAVVKTSTNLNSDPVNMLMHCLRLGISTGTYGLILTNLMNDIIMGPPQITMDPVGLGVIDPEYINIMITGHQQAMFNNLQESLEKESDT